MRSKLTKTIFTIVFVVFLGLIGSKKVDAYYAFCHYKSEDSSSRAVMYIDDSFENARGLYIGTGNTVYVGLKVKNWEQPATTKTNYFAYDDAWKNDHCPQYLFYTVSGRGNRNIQRFFYMSDADNLEVHKEAFESYYQTVKVLAIDSNTFPSEKSEFGTYIPPRRCDCENGRAYFIADKGSLDAPKVEGDTVQNWVSVDHYAAIDAIKTNECLDLIYDASGSSVYLSDSAHYEEIYSVSGGNSAITCKLNSQTPIEVERPKPEYNPPTVRGDIIGPLSSNSTTYSCGNGYMTDIPSGIVRIVNIFYIILQILVPIALVILGSLDLVKALAAQKEDEIKKGQQTFVKRLIAAVIIFFVFILIKLVVGIFSNDDNAIISCMNCFLQGIESCD